MTRMARCVFAGGAEDVAGSEEEDERDAVAGLRDLSRLRALASAGERPLRTVAAALRLKPAVIATAPVIDLLLRGNSAAFGASVEIAGVPLPVLATDSPSVLPAALAVAGCSAHEVAAAVVPSLSRYPTLELCGWASDADVMSRTDPRAAGARRGTLMSLLLGCLQQASSLAPPPSPSSQAPFSAGDELWGGRAAAPVDPQAGLGFLSPVGSLGHWLLGLKHASARSRQGVNSSSLGAVQGQYTIPRPGDVTCLHAVVGLLGIESIAERRPSISQQAAAVVHALLAGPETRRCTLAFLQVRNALHTIAWISTSFTFFCVSLSAALAAEYGH
jgi:hypothetical protein